jgi:YesN/AraC family two-component response regulator
MDGKNYIDDIIDDGNARYFMVNDSAQTTTNINENSREKENTILVVEDNKDLRTYLYNILCNDYNVILAENGYIGIEKARKYMPDFIITDITMPVLDGLTMIRMIREDSDINHLPIIILSARASEKDRNLGNELGVLGYITKPFSATYLKGRVDNFIAQRKAMQQQLLSKIRILNNEENSNQQNSLNDYHPNAGIYNEDGLQYQDEKSSIQGINDKVIQKVILYLDENLSNPDLKIDHIAIEMGMSRSVLYSKIRNAVGMSPVGFVRRIRILRAEELIGQTEDSFSQIAYTVGFSDPKYFTKVFKKETGMTPSEYRDSNK